MSPNNIDSSLIDYERQIQILEESSLDRASSLEELRAALEALKDQNFNLSNQLNELINAKNELEQLKEAQINQAIFIKTLLKKEEILNQQILIERSNKDVQAPIKNPQFLQKNTVAATLFQSKLSFAEDEVRIQLIEIQNSIGWRVIERYHDLVSQSPKIHRILRFIPASFLAAMNGNLFVVIKRRIKSAISSEK